MLCTLLVTMLAWPHSSTASPPAEEVRASVAHWQEYLRNYSAPPNMILDDPGSLMNRVRKWVVIGLRRNHLDQYLTLYQEARAYQHLAGQELAYARIMLEIGHTGAAVRARDDAASYIRVAKLLDDAALEVWEGNLGKAQQHLYEAGKAINDTMGLAGKTIQALGKSTGNPVAVVGGSILGYGATGLNWVLDSAYKDVGTATRNAVIDVAAENIVEQAVKKAAEKRFNVAKETAGEMGSAAGVTYSAVKWARSVAALAGDKQVVPPQELLDLVARELKAAGRPADEVAEVLPQLAAGRYGRLLHTIARPLVSAEKPTGLLTDAAGADSKAKPPSQPSVPTASPRPAQPEPGDADEPTKAKAPAAQADPPSGRWEPGNEGVPAGPVEFVVVHPRDARIVYAGGDCRGVFKSADEGSSWTWVSSSLTGDGGQALRTLVVHPAEFQVLYGYDSTGVRKSTDGGATWKSANSGLTSAFGAGAYISSLVMDPVDPQVLYVAEGSGGGVFKSTNGAASWKPVNSGLPDLQITCLAVDPNHPATVYAATANSGIFKTTDGGGTWRAVNSGLPDVRIGIIAVAPRDSRVVYAATSTGDGVFRSLDGGESWTGCGLAGLFISSLVVDPQNTLVVYVGTHFGGVFKTTDGGQSWTSSSAGLMNPALPPIGAVTVNDTLVHLRPAGGLVHSLAIDPHNPRVLYAATGNGVFRTTDGGGAWKAASVGLPRVAVDSLLVDPANPLNLYAGTRSLGVLKSTDGGSSWSMASMGLTDLKVGTLAVDPHNPKTLYAGTRGGVFKSTDAGGSWTLVGLANIFVFSLTVDPHQPQTVYAATWDRGVFKTADGGASWNPVNNGLQDLFVYALAVVPQDPRTLYAGTRNGGIFKSVDGAASWRQVNKGLTDFHVWDVAVDPRDPQTVYAATLNGGVFKSADGGSSWTAANSGFGCLDIFRLAVSQQNPEVLYAGRWGRGVSVSINGGSSWVQMSEGLLDGVVAALVVNPQDSRVVYAGTHFGGGIFRWVSVPNRDR